MDSKKAGYVFFTQIVLSIGVSLWLGFGVPSFDLPIVANLIFSESLILVPSLVFLAATGTKTKTLISFRKLKISTVFLVLLFTMLMSPLITAVNAFSMIFTDNTVMAVSDEVLSKPYPIIVFLIGIFGPFCEEFAFRGVIFGSFRRTGRILGAALLQALLFGLMHLNFNQFCYAFVIGIALAVLVEVTESLWAGFIMHAAINTSNVTMLYLTKPLLQELGGVPSEEIYGMNTMIIMMCVYLVISLFTTSFAACVMVWISKNEGRENRLYAFVQAGKKIPEEKRLVYEEQKNENHLVYGITVVSMILCVGYIILVEVLKRI